MLFRIALGSSRQGLSNTVGLGLLSVIIGALSPQHAVADINRVSSDGDVYIVSENAHGFVLTSQYPKTRFIEGGSNSSFNEARDVFYFGRSCDTFHKDFGAGTWGWANAGFGATFENGFSLWFPRQDVPWEGGFECRE